MEFEGEKYSWEDILSMFGGFKYFSKEHLLCLYHNVNGRDKEAEVYQDLINEESDKVKRALKKMIDDQPDQPDQQSTQVTQHKLPTQENDKNDQEI